MGIMVLYDDDDDEMDVGVAVFLLSGWFAYTPNDNRLPEFGLFAPSATHFLLSTLLVSVISALPIIFWWFIAFCPPVTEVHHSFKGLLNPALLWDPKDQ